MYTFCRRQLLWLLVLGVALQVSASYPDYGGDGSGGVEISFNPGKELKKGVCCTHEPYNTTRIETSTKLVTEPFVDSRTELQQTWCPGVLGTDLLRVKWCTRHQRITFMSTRQVTRAVLRKIITETTCDVDATVCCPGKMDVDGQCIILHCSPGEVIRTARKDAAKIKKARKEAEDLLGSLFG